MALRCPWCARRVDDNVGFCASCTAELVSASAWPAARMLVDAGVDRIALPERVRTLDDVTRVRLERAFEVQAAVVRARLVEATALASHLRDPDLVDAVGDQLWPLLPLSPDNLRVLGLPDARSLSTSAELAALVAREDDVSALRQLAAIVLLRRGEGTRAADDLVDSALFGDDAIAREAAMLLGAPSSRGLDRHTRDRVKTGLHRARDVVIFHDDATVALALLDEAFASAHVDDLAAIADNTRAPRTRRVHAAVAIDDVDRLVELVTTIDDDPDDITDTALRAIGRSCRADDVIAAAIARLSRDDRHALLKSLREPGPRVRRVLLDDLDGAPVATVTATFAVLRRLPFHALDVDEHRAVARAAVDVGVDALFELLHWHKPRVDNDVDTRLVTALATATAHAPDSVLAHRLFDSVVATLVDVDNAADVEAVYAPLLQTDAGTAKVVHGLLWRADREPRVLQLLTALWPLSSSRAAGWAQAVRRGGTHDTVIAWVWQRFVDVPAERAALFTAFAPWRRELRAVRDALPREHRPGGGSAVAHLALWLDVDDDVLTVVSDAFALADDSDLVDVVRPIFLHAHALLRARAFRLALVVVFRLCSRIEHASRRATEVDDDHHDHHEDGDVTAFPRSLTAAHDALEERLDGFIADVRRRVADDVDGALHFLDDIAVERRLLDEQRQRRRARDAPPPPRTEPVVATPAPPWTPPPKPLVVLPIPAFAPSSVDVEPYDAGLGLPTLLSYAQVLIAMQQGHDAMGIFAAAGLDVPGWVAAANRWSQRFGQKPALAMRFGELLQLPWQAP